jgi:hypothetical protein
VIGLPEGEREANGVGAREAALFDIGQRVGAINRRFALTEHVQIRSVEKQDLGRCRHGLLSGGVGPRFGYGTGFGYNICAARRNNAASIKGWRGR